MLLRLGDRQVNKGERGKGRLSLTGRTLVDQEFTQRPEKMLGVTLETSEDWWEETFLGATHMMPLRWPPTLPQGSLVSVPEREGY